MRYSRLIVSAMAIFLSQPSAHAQTGSTNSNLQTDPKLGVYRGAGCDGRPRVAEFASWLGRKPGWVVDFLAFKDWNDVRNSARWVVHCWKGAPYRLSLAVPLLPRDNKSTLADGARGAYDDVYRQLARLLVDEGLPNTEIRLAWEFNGNWMPWDAAKDPSNFVSYWRRVVGVMRSVPETNFKFEWSPAKGKNSIAPDAVYPGDDVVDVIGESFYNQSWTVPQSNLAGRWRESLVMPYGLDWHKRFAAEHKKPRAYPEWGTGQRPDGAGGGDDDYFIRQMAAAVRTPDVLYYSYFDFPAPDYNAFISGGKMPRAAEAFRSEFGSKSPR